MRLFWSIHITKRDYVRLFWICAGAHLLLWTIIPALTCPNTLTDVIEGYVWGREWPLGTYKHPPLAAWILETLATVTGRARGVDFFANQVSVVVAFWAVWQTGRRIIGEPGALIGALLLAGVAYYNILIPEFNPNVLQLPFWALMGWSFHRAVKDNRVTDWLLLGLWSAGGLYAKYSSVLMLIALAFVMLAHADGRKRLKSPGPWLAMLTALMLLAPHIVWLFAHHFIPFAYAESRMGPPTSGPVFLLAPALLILWQLAAVAPAILIYSFAFRRDVPGARRDTKSFDRMFLSVAAFGPFIMAFMMAAIYGVTIRNMWGAPFWNFLGLWAVYTFRPDFSAAALRRFAYLLVFVFVAGLIGTAGKNIFEPYVTHKAGRIYFPGRALAQQISEEWEKRYHAPLRYVIGDVWVAGNVAYYAPGGVAERPHVLINGDYSISPGVTPEDIAKYGGVIVWCRGDCTHQDIYDVPEWYWPEFQTRAPFENVLTFPQQTGANVPPAKIGWAIVGAEGDKPLVDQGLLGQTPE